VKKSVVFNTVLDRGALIGGHLAVILRLRFPDDCKTANALWTSLHCLLNHTRQQLPRVRYFGRVIYLTVEKRTSDGRIICTLRCTSKEYSLRNNDCETLPTTDRRFVNLVTQVDVVDLEFCKSSSTERCGVHSAACPLTYFRTRAWLVSKTKKTKLYGVVLVKQRSAKHSCHDSTTENSTTTSQQHNNNKQHCNHNYKLNKHAQQHQYDKR
jgi:hypothetical protein